MKVKKIYINSCAECPDLELDQYGRYMCKGEYTRTFITSDVNKINKSIPLFCMLKDANEEK